MIIDTHIHESKYSDDSNVSLEEIIFKAKAIGLDGICITNHENKKIEKKAYRLAQKTDLLILVGAEILTYEGDLLVFGLDRLPDKKMHAQKLINIVNTAGGVAISAHPFRNNDRGMGENISKVKGLSGVEVLNGSTTFANNLAADNLAKSLSLPCLGASDAHHADKVGKYATYFYDDIKNIRDFINAIKNNRVSPAVYIENQFKVIKKVNNNRFIKSNKREILR